MSPRKTLAYLVVLAVLFGVIRLVILPREEAAQLAGKFVGDARDIEIASVELGSGDGVVRLVNEAPVAPPFPTPVPTPDFERWRVEGGGSQRVEPAAVRELLRAVTTLELGTPLPAAEVSRDLALYGLATPAARAVIERVGGSRLAISLGKQNQFLDGKRYAQREGSQELFLVTNDIFNQITKGRADFREKNPVAFADRDLAAITITGGGSTVTIAQHPPGVWRISSPRELRASAEAVRGLLGELRRLRASGYRDFSSPEEAKTAFGPGGVSILLRQTEERPDIEVIVRAEGSGALFGRRDRATLYEIADRNPTAQLMKSVVELRERKQFDIDANGVASVVVTRGKEQILAMERIEEVWRVNGKEGDEPFIREYLNGLSGAIVENFADGASINVADPLLRVAVKERDGAERTLTVIREEKGKGYLALVESGEPFYVSAETLKKLTPNVESLIVVATPTPVPTVE